jgi:hypothetical protein
MIPRRPRRREGGGGDQHEGVTGRRLEAAAMPNDALRLAVLTDDDQLLAVGQMITLDQIGELKTLVFENTAYDASWFEHKQLRLQMRDKVKKLLGEQTSDAFWKPLMDFLNRG